jgi:hypothetical protein
MDDTAPAREILAEKLRVSLALSEDGFALKRQQLRRRFPEADEAEIDRLFRAWLQDRPGAEYGDGVGTPVTWPDRKPLLD